MLHSGVVCGFGLGGLAGGSFEDFLLKLGLFWLQVLLAYWLKTQLFNFWASYKVVYPESFNFCFLRPVS